MTKKQAYQLKPGDKITVKIPCPYESRYNPDKGEYEDIWCEPGDIFEFVDIAPKVRIKNYPWCDGYDERLHCRRPCRCGRPRCRPGDYEYASINFSNAVKL